MTQVRLGGTRIGLLLIGLVASSCAGASTDALTVSAVDAPPVTTVEEETEAPETPDPVATEATSTTTATPAVAATAGDSIDDRVRSLLEQPISEDALVRILLSEGYEEEQVADAVDSLEVDWYLNAVLAARTPEALEIEDRWERREWLMTEGEFGNYESWFAAVRHPASDTEVYALVWAHTNCGGARPAVLSCLEYIGLSPQDAAFAASQINYESRALDHVADNLYHDFDSGMPRPSRRETFSELVTFGYDWFAATWAVDAVGLVNEPCTDRSFVCEAKFGEYWPMRHWSPSSTATCTNYQVDEGLPIAPCSRGRGVSLVQKELGVDADGYFGPGTEIALRFFQASVGLPETGVINADTWAALGVTAELEVGTGDNEIKDGNKDGVIDWAEVNLGR